MAKLSQLDKAIDNLEKEIQVLELAVLHLRQQREAAKAKPARKPKLVAIGDGK